MLIVIDGREFDFPVLDTLTFRESQLVKKVTGLRMGQFADALEAGDVDMLLAMALLAKKRQDGIVDDDALLDMPIAKVEVVMEPGDEGEDVPPAEPAEEPAPQVEPVAESTNPNPA